MGTITASTLISRARHILQDTTSGGTRWLDAELLKWLNDAQREIVLLKPNAYSVVENMSLATGTKQTLPSGGLMLLAVVRNNSGSSKRAVRRVDRAIMDSENPDWHNASAAATVEHYIFDEQASDTFWVSPPQPSPATGIVELIYSKAPADVAAVGNAITLNDVYANAILDYILYRAYSKDTDYAGNQSRAANHYNAFNNSLGVKVQVESATSPNQAPMFGRASA